MTAAPLAWRSASATRCDLHDTTSEDAALELVDAGVFAVADGMGGHTDGIIRRGSYMHDLLDAKMADIEAALRSVNEALRREVALRGGSVIIGSTVAVLVISNHYAVCIWIGDSRIYLCRQGALYQLTKDHTLQEEDGDALGGVLIRTTDSAETIVLDRIVTTVEDNDTFLACSDGITKVLSDRDLNTARIVASAVEAGSTDDISAIPVRCVRADT